MLQNKKDVKIAYQKKLKDNLIGRLILNDKKILEINSINRRIGRKAIEIDKIQLTTDGKNSSPLLIKDFSYSFNHIIFKFIFCCFL